eukprot:CAMPEP_0184655160 /NCGR_PEP_ID=MMETSP0308-20130426/12781_1 /TAXON_ID=38269 /ORGANISM="Gloeochaete witrockiana, Strain SAG 46.84" /LENGTH=1156 /DNA_ID=CAMNT_0027091467 /DNA_START=812 /DNA_END=4282 /DNA_ORIENTATION=+
MLAKMLDENARLQQQLDRMSVRHGPLAAAICGGHEDALTMLASLTSEAAALRRASCVSPIVDGLSNTLEWSLYSFDVYISALDELDRQLQWGSLLERSEEHQRAQQSVQKAIEDTDMGELRRCVDLRNNCRNRYEAALREILTTHEQMFDLHQHRVTEISEELASLKARLPQAADIPWLNSSQSDVQVNTGDAPLVEAAHSLPELSSVQVDSQEDALADQSLPELSSPVSSAGSAGEGSLSGSPTSRLSRLMRAKTSSTGPSLASAEALKNYRLWQSDMTSKLELPVWRTNNYVAECAEAVKGECDAFKKASAGDGPLAVGPNISRDLVASVRNHVQWLENEQRAVEQAKDHVAALKAPVWSQLEKSLAIGGMLEEAAVLKDQIERMEEKRVELSKAKTSLMVRREDTRTEAGDRALSEKQRNSLFKAVDELDEEIKKHEAEILAATSARDKCAARLDELSKSGHLPELTIDLHSAVRSSTRATGLLRKDRKLYSYRLLRAINRGMHNVYLAQYYGKGSDGILEEEEDEEKEEDDDASGGDLCVLKEFPFSQNQYKKSFNTEVRILSKISHPNIVPITCVFIDGLSGYLEMPYYPKGSLRDWALSEEVAPLSVSSKEALLRSVFHQLLEGLAYLHDHNCVHRDLKPDNVLIDNGGHPVISDFGISKDTKALHQYITSLVTSTTNSEVVGTLGYIAPEVLSKLPATAASDMYAVGVMLAETILQVRPEHIATGSTTWPAKSNARLVDLVEQLLSKDPADRPTATQALVHSFFTVLETLQLAVDEKKQQERGSRALQVHLDAIRREASRSTLSIHVRREQIVDEVINAFTTLNEQSILQPLRVTFEGEAGIDAGGLTSDLFTDFFTKVFQPEAGLFETAEDGQSGTHIAYTDTFYLPLKGAPLQSLESFGKVVAKSIFEGRQFPLDLAPCVYKFLRDNNAVMNLNDLECFNPGLAAQYHRLLSRPGAGRLDLTMDGLVSEGDKIPVTDTNKTEYVNLNIKRILVDERLGQLEALRRGFFIINIANLITTLSITDIMAICCGQRHLNGSSIADSITFSGFPPQSTTPSLLKTLLGSLLPADSLRRFLRLCTGRCTLPPGAGGGSLFRITVCCTRDPTRLPVGHTCGSQLDLPDYGNMNLLTSKLNIALSEMADGTFRIG